MSIYDRIIKLLAEHTGKDASEFTPETTFESLGIDSLPLASWSNLLKSA